MISNFAVRARLTGAVPVATGADYELWRPAGTPRMALFVGGLYHDGWLSPAGHLTRLPGRQRPRRRDAALPLSLPAATKRDLLRLQGPGVDRRVTVVPGKSIVVTVQVSHRGPWTLNWHSEPHRLPAAGRPPDQRAGRDADVRRQLPRQRGA